jgi:hypothetical protein
MAFTFGVVYQLKLISMLLTTHSSWGLVNATQGVISPYERRARSLSSDDVPRIISAALFTTYPSARASVTSPTVLRMRSLAAGSQSHHSLEHRLPCGSETLTAGAWWSRSSAKLPRRSSAGAAHSQDPNSYNPNKGPLLIARRSRPGVFQPAAPVPLAQVCTVTPVAVHVSQI